MTAVVVVYDIASAKGGAKRLKKVSSICGKWGNSVQHSVYECLLDAERLRALRAELMTVIDPELDSVRFYQLGKHFRTRISTIGKERRTWDRETFVI